MTLDFTGTDALNLSAQTLRVARHLGYLYGEEREIVITATACAIAALAAGSVCFELSGPDGFEWRQALESSPLVSAQLDRPLVLDGMSVYLTRYWMEQARIVDWIFSRTITNPNPSASDDPSLQAALDRYFPDPSDQRDAAKQASQHSFCVIAGGPGTGKTTTVAGLLAVMASTTSTPLRVILAAPTGRAAARLEQAVRENLAGFGDLDPDLRYSSGTLHRVLGLKPWGPPTMHAAHPVPADVVVVDEASMLSLHLMSLLLDAIAPTTRLILVGDPDQLASVEAGAVLADIVASDVTVPVTRLTHTYRFGGAIADLAETIRVGDAESALAILAGNPDEIEWIPTPAASASPEALQGLRETATNQGRALIEAASAGEMERALTLLDSHRLLVGHRHGLVGVSYWTRQVRGWIAPGTEWTGHWYPGMPVLITGNDDLLGIYNGDSGVIVEKAGELLLAVGDGVTTRLITPDLIQSWEPLYASTIHKSQGSQFNTVSLILPPATTALLTRELFYTAVTRAKTFLCVIGDPDSVRHAITSPALRASGLALKLAALHSNLEI
ncbi:MAG: exodeoxyribonuclease V subunit alpha [Propionibacteriaceae bacterium]|jgi:exodeoxyribonuclease V alpha subunit|nr:exodeoxyribonuclease V subunit alpha [Propionibacteriaceae bacterium]